MSRLNEATVSSVEEFVCNVEEVRICTNVEACQSKVVCLLVE